MNSTLSQGIALPDPADLTFADVQPAGQRGGLTVDRTSEPVAATFLLQSIGMAG